MTADAAQLEQIAQVLGPPLNAEQIVSLFGDDRARFANTVRLFSVGKARFVKRAGPPILHMTFTLPLGLQAIQCLEFACLQMPEDSEIKPLIIRLVREALKTHDQVGASIPQDDLARRYTVCVTLKGEDMRTEWITKWRRGIMMPFTAETVHEHELKSLTLAFQLNNEVLYDFTED